MVHVKVDLKLLKELIAKEQRRKYLKSQISIKKNKQVFIK